MSDAPLLPGMAATWRPASGGIGNTVTIQQVTLDKAQVHVTRKATGTCAVHWVDLATLSPAPEGTVPCACTRDAAKAS